MTIRQTVRRALAVTSVVAMAASTVTDASAAPQAARPDVITMVNGAGNTITIPKPLLPEGRPSAAGSTGWVPPGAALADPNDRHANANVVIGADERAQEPGPYPYPWRAIAHLTTDKATTGCTGFMISHDVLVTAAHCVYNSGWARSYTVTPGRFGDYQPWGSCTGGIDDVWTTGGWLSAPSPDNDVGLIKLTCDVGNATGWFGWWYDSGANMSAPTFWLEGYPNDKPWGTLWFSHGRVTEYTVTRMNYTMDTALEMGDHGAPIYVWGREVTGRCSGWCVTGIHTGWGVLGGTSNQGTRFTADVMTFINYWVNQP